MTGFSLPLSSLGPTLKLREPGLVQSFDVGEALGHDVTLAERPHAQMDPEASEPLCDAHFLQSTNPNQRISFSMSKVGEPEEGSHLCK